MSLRTESTRPFPKQLYIPIGLLLLIYLPALIDLVQDWVDDSNYSHGFLVPLVSGWLIWKKREQFANIQYRIDSTGLFLLIAGMIFFVLGNGAAEYFSLRFSFVLTLTGVIWYFLGRQVIRLIWFELFFLLFMIPIPYVLYYSVTFPMQLLASKITAGIMNVVGMGVVRQGNILHIQDYSLEVAEACSGVRSLISLLALGAFYAQMTQKRFSGKLILFLSTIPIAVIGNVVRVMVTSLIAYLVTTDITSEPMHSLLGMIVFVIAFILLFILSAILTRVFK